MHFMGVAKGHASWRLLGKEATDHQKGNTKEKKGRSEGSNTLFLQLYGEFSVSIEFGQRKTVTDGPYLMCFFVWRNNL